MWRLFAPDPKGQPESRDDDQNRATLDDFCGCCFPEGSETYMNLQKSTGRDREDCMAIPEKEREAALLDLQMKPIDRGVTIIDVLSDQDAEGCPVGDDDAAWRFAHHAWPEKRRRACRTWSRSRSAIVAG